MTDHADTIRRPTAEEVLRQYVQSGSIMLQEPANGRRQVTAGEALRALAILLAERQQAIDALREIASSQSMTGTPGILDRSYGGRQAQAMKQRARAALVSLGEQQNG